MMDEIQEKEVLLVIIHGQSQIGTDERQYLLCPVVGMEGSNE
jgi:hypothetical protein